MKRTGSIGSRVPPAETSTRSPSQGPLAGGQHSLDRGQQAPGSGRRPLRARRGRPALPPPGSITRDPALAQRREVGLGRRVGYIRSFIAGATSRGAAQARKEVVTIESAIPAASLATVFAEAGAIR